MTALTATCRPATVHCVPSLVIAVHIAVLDIIGTNILLCQGSHPLYDRGRPWSIVPPSLMLIGISIDRASTASGTQTIHLRQEAQSLTTDRYLSSHWGRVNKLAGHELFPRSVHNTDLACLFIVLTVLVCFMPHTKLLTGCNVFRSL